MPASCPIVSENFICVRELPELTLLFNSNVNCVAGALLKQGKEFLTVPEQLLLKHSQEAVSSQTGRAKLADNLKEACLSYYHDRGAQQIENPAALKEIYKYLHEIYDNANQLLSELNNFLGETELFAMENYFVPLTYKEFTGKASLPNSQDSDNEFFQRADNVLLGAGQQIFLNALNIYSLYLAILNTNREKVIARAGILAFSSFTNQGNVLWRSYRDYTHTRIEYNKRFAEVLPERLGVYYHRRVLFGAANALDALMRFIERR